MARYIPDETLPYSVKSVFLSPGNFDSRTISATPMNFQGMNRIHRTAILNY